MARPEPFDSPLILSLSKDERLAQDRPFDSPLILSLSKDGRLAQDRPVEGRVFLLVVRQAHHERSVLIVRMHHITRSSRVSDTASTATKYLQNLWDEAEAVKLSAHPLDLLRYRSNLLGADLRITNFGGGNTSSKFTLPDPLTGRSVRVLAVKGSGGDLRSIGASGFAVLYLDKLELLIGRYRGEGHE